MEVEVIGRLMQERQTLVARLAKIDNMLRQFEELGRAAQQLLTHNIPPDGESMGGRVETEARTSGASLGPSDLGATIGSEKIETRALERIRRATRKTPMPEFEAAVIAVLRESRNPMNRVQLYEELTARGIVIGSGGREQDLNSLSARVYRMAKDPLNRISGERGQGYRLLDTHEVPTSEPEIDAPTVSDNDLF